MLLRFILKIYINNQSLYFVSCGFSYLGSSETVFELLDAWCLTKRCSCLGSYVPQKAAFSPSIWNPLGACYLIFSYGHWIELIRACWRAKAWTEEEMLRQRLFSFPWESVQRAKWYETAERCGPPFCYWNTVSSLCLVFVVLHLTSRWTHLLLHKL